MKVYLSGGIEYAKNHGQDWRNEIEIWLKNTLSHSTYNPVIATENHIKKNYSGINFRELKTSSPELYHKILSEIVLLDLDNLKNCDYVICLWDESARQGAGTQGEVTVAKFLNKPVYLVALVPFEEIPGWIIGCADGIFKDFEDLKNFLARKFTSSDETNAS